MRRRSVTLIFVALFVAWNMATYVFLTARTETKSEDDGNSEDEIQRQLSYLDREIKGQISHHETLLKELRAHIERLSKNQQALEKADAQQAVLQQPIRNQHNKDGVGGHLPRADDTHADDTVLPVLVIACNRVTVNRNLDQLLDYRPSEKRFPIIVSQDCGHQATANVIRSYGDKLTHIQHGDLSDIPLPPKQKKFKDYYKIARHYKWALNQVFHRFNHSAVIIVEDDLNISPDFYEYFAATFPILREDSSLFCVSAWNDNGKGTHISDDAELLYRTDFFPGLGWMMERKTWLELEQKWPDTFWDDWLRHPDQRQDRSCIRPEISRTNTFGKIGASKGQFFEKYLKFIQLNEKFVPFTKMDLSYLVKEKYDPDFVQMVYSAPLFTAPQVLSGSLSGHTTVRVQYNDAKQYKLFAKQLGIMDDLKAGVPRAGYRGVVSFYRSGIRVYLAPAPTWTKYDPSWT